jgi:hypothetical protein
MNVFKKALVMLALGVGSLFLGLGAADAQWGYRSGFRGGYGGYAPRNYGGGYQSYYGSPYRYRSYYGGPSYYGGGYRNYGGYGGGYYGGSGVYLGRGGIGIRF